MREGDVVSSWEKDMWEYFGSLYKNCNKGIKGRGKDRRISNTGLGLLETSGLKDEDDSRRSSYSSISSLENGYSPSGPNDPLEGMMGFGQSYGVPRDGATY